MKGEIAEPKGTAQSVSRLKRLGAFVAATLVCVGLLCAFLVPAVINARNAARKAQIL
jgi:hypothetical protein